MADFTIIADASSALLKLLRESLCPDPIISPESIALVAPTDKNSDFQLGLYLYDIKELSEYKTTAPRYSADNIRTPPPRPLSLYYMLYLNSKAQISSMAETEQRVLGKALQTLMSTGEINLSEANPFLQADEAGCLVTVINQSFEEKTKIWSALQSAYQVSASFILSPVMLSMRTQEKITRVTQTDITLDIKN